MHQILKTTLNLITTLHFSVSISKILSVNQNQVQKVNQQIVIGNNGKKKNQSKSFPLSYISLSGLKF